MAIYDQVCDAQEAAFVIEPTIVTTMFVELKKMFEQIVRHQVSGFLFQFHLTLHQHRRPKMMSKLQ